MYLVIQNPEGDVAIYLRGILYDTAGEEAFEFPKRNLIYSLGDLALIGAITVEYRTKRKAKAYQHAKMLEILNQ